MMSDTVWVAYYGHAYEPGFVIGVFATRDIAERQLNKHSSNYADVAEVKEMTVGEVEKFRV